jgi:competence protein ComEC
MRCLSVTLAVLAVAIALAALAAPVERRVACLAVALALGGWWWGSVRLAALDRSPLRSRIGTAERAVVVVTSPVNAGRFDLRVRVLVERFGDLQPHESALLELPVGRSPPQGARLDVLGELREPRGPANGFDERTWLRRHGIHVVLHGDRWTIVGRRGGLGAVADRLRERIARAIAYGVDGEREAVLDGVVFGDDGGLSDELKQRFQTSGLYHLLAVSGENVALVASGALLLAWLCGIPRIVGEVLALGAIGGYVLAVGPQPSVIRAGVAGALGSLAWLAARPRDRWYFVLLGALVLLAWNPYTLLDAGFQLSFAAVAAIFMLVPRIQHVLEGYPVPRPLATVVAVSTACGAVTAPILWLQFHRIPLLTVPANALAAPAVVPLLGLALAAALVAPLAPAAAGALAWLDGWCAAYLATCARLVGGLPFAQVSSPGGAAALALLVAGGGTYAWSRWRVT